METPVAYTTPVKPTVTRTSKAAKSARPIPEGYISLDEFCSIFHRKLDEAYAKLGKQEEEGRAEEKRKVLYLSCGGFQTIVKEARRA